MKKWIEKRWLICRPWQWLNGTATAAASVPQIVVTCQRRRYCPQTGQSWPNPWVSKSVWKMRALTKRLYDLGGSQEPGRPPHFALVHVLGFRIYAFNNIHAVWVARVNRKPANSHRFLQETTRSRPIFDEFIRRIGGVKFWVAEQE